jgi:cobalamin biosynthesis Mg chelatase CobN
VKAKARVKASASARPSPSVSESVSPPTADDSNAEATKKTSGEFTPAEQDSGLPVWVPIVVLLGLGGAAGGAVWWRRRTGAA